MIATLQEFRLIGVVASANERNCHDANETSLSESPGALPRAFRSVALATSLPIRQGTEAAASSPQLRCAYPLLWNIARDVISWRV